MTKRIFTFIIVAFISLNLISCGGDAESKAQTQEQKDQELLTQEREKATQELNAQTDSIVEMPEETDTKKSKDKVRQLRYLYASNGGLVGYFDDGTIVTCPKCDLDNGNVRAMFKEKSTSKYQVSSDGAILEDGSKVKQYPNYEEDPSWVLIDYKWNEKVPE